jgi:hypothetical protein
MTSKPLGSQHILDAPLCQGPSVHCTSLGYHMHHGLVIVITQPCDFLGPCNVLLEPISAKMEFQVLI